VLWWRSGAAFPTLPSKFVFGISALGRLRARSAARDQRTRHTLRRAHRWNRGGSGRRTTLTLAAGRAAFGDKSRNAANNEQLPVFTVGHSTRSIFEFVMLLRAGAVRLVVDVRHVPRSRANPQFNLDVLANELKPYQIGYLCIPELGGLRKHASGVSPDVNAFWDNQSFHNYADYALSAAFRSGFDQLLQVASQRRTAIMCAEAVWWRCHRRIIADYLIDAGRPVYHLMGDTKVEAAKLTIAATHGEDGLHYPGHTGGEA